MSGFNDRISSDKVLGHFVWDDIRFPMTAANLDTNSGKVDYNYFNGGADFQSNALYPDHPLSFICQMQHDWKLESNIHPHIHWLQNNDKIPNWLLAYKIIENGKFVVDSTDFSNHTLLIPDKVVFPYTSGDLAQISTFPVIDMSGIVDVSTMIHFVLFRDTSNVSGLFAGVDPISAKRLVYEFDIHYQKDALGSELEYKKSKTL